MARSGQVTALLVSALLVLPTIGACSNSSSPTPGGSVSVSPSSTEPTVAVIGMTEAQAAAWAGEHGYTTRVISVDGVAGPVTLDFSEQRINLALENGVVVTATIG